MSDTKAITSAAAALRSAGTPFLVATVVRVRGSAYRRPGARMLVTEERWIAGSVSGGCLEGDVLRKGFWRTRGGAPVVITYDSTDRDENGWSFGLGCEGVIDLLLERPGAADRADPLRFTERCMEKQRRGAIVTVFHSETPRVPVGARVCLERDGACESTSFDADARARLVAGAESVIARGATAVRSFDVAGGHIEALVEAVAPPVRLFVFGTGHDAVPVAALGRSLGWDVIVWEGRARSATHEHFAMADEILVTSLPGALARVNESDRPIAIVMGHHYEQDRAALAMLLGSRAQYIGVLGPRRRAEKMLEELGRPAAPCDARLHAPVGLELGAETPHEIALAIVAEVQSVLARAPAAHLRERPSPIHADLTS